MDCNKASNYFKQKRYGYFLIWGNGLQYKDEITKIIEDQCFIEILKVINYKPRNIKQFVRSIYSYDYAPFAHLKQKTKYLLKTKPDVFFIFFRNNDADEAFFGEELFRHVECQKIKYLKELIRNQFNPKINGQRTEEHVIHASDNESQTDKILKYLGLDKGIAIFNNHADLIVDYPYYLGKISKFTIKLANLDSVYCNVLQGRRDSYFSKIVPIPETPQYACLNGNTDAYRQYLNEFLGGPLDCNYSVAKLLDLSKNFIYLHPPNSNKYVITQEFAKNKYLILDGVHRASILKFNRITSAPIVVLSKYE